MNNKLWVGLVAVALAACGGGGGSSSTTSTPNALNVTGTAATGIAMAGASIKIQCSNGSTSTVTADVSGNYTAAITNGSLPCVVTATSSDQQTVLHSVIGGSGTSTGTATANVTPLSELLLAQATATTPSTYIQNFGASSTISAASVSTAQNAVLNGLQSAGVSTSGVGSIVTGTIAAGSGQGYDAVLDKLETTLTSAGSKLSDLTSAFATNASSTTNSAAVATSVLAPASHDCSTLKSGIQQLILDSAANYEVTLDVSAGTVAITPASTAYTYSYTKNGSCDFNVSDGSGQVARFQVSSAGLLVWELDPAFFTNGSPTGSYNNMAISMPEQNLDITALTGSYDYLIHGSGLTGGLFGTVTIDQNGVATSSYDCTGYGNCSTNSSPLQHLTSNGNGSFNWVNDAQSGTVTGTLFAYRLPDGQTLMMGKAANSTSLQIYANQAKSIMYPVGTVSHGYSISSQTGTVTVGTYTTTISALTGSTTTRQIVPGTGTSFQDIAVGDDPFLGARHRASNTCTLINSSTPVSCLDVVQLIWGAITASNSSSTSSNWLTFNVNFN